MEHQELVTDINKFKETLEDAFKDDLYKFKDVKFKTLYDENKKEFLTNIPDTYKAVVDNNLSDLIKAIPDLDTLIKHRINEIENVILFEVAVKLVKENELINDELFDKIESLIDFKISIDIRKLILSKLSKYVLYCQSFC